MKVSASHRGVLSRVLGIVHCGGIAFPEVLEHFLATALLGVVVVQNLKPGLGRARIRRDLWLLHVYPHSQQVGVGPIYVGTSEVDYDVLVGTNTRGIGSRRALVPTRTS